MLKVRQHWPIMELILNFFLFNLICLRGRHSMGEFSQLTGTELIEIGNSVHMSNDSSVADCNFTKKISPGRMPFRLLLIIFIGLSLPTMATLPHIRNIWEAYSDRILFCVMPKCSCPTPPPIMYWSNEQKYVLFMIIQV